MVDFHTHLLPQIDDGSRSAEESEALLRLLYQQGVELAVATPHFYADRMTPQEFLRRRDEAQRKLPRRAEGEMPRLAMGAEVAFFEGIGHSEEIEALCIKGTRTLLLEMPFSPWTPRMLTEVEDLQYRREIKVVLAHIERYLPMQSRDICRQVCSGELLLQMNAGVLLSLRTRSLGLRLLKNGYVHLLGSDCHGTEYRPPRMAEAAEYIRKKLGEDVLTRLDNMAKELLPAAERAMA